MRKKFMIMGSITITSVFLIGLFLFNINKRSYTHNFSPFAENVEIVETNRVWLKITSSSWQDNNALTQIHYFNGTSSNETTWPGNPLYYDLANEAYYYDLPQDIQNYMFTRVDQRNNYLMAKTNDLAYANSLNKIYTISGAISGANEVIVAGSYSAFEPITTSKVSNFITTLDDGQYICNYDHALKELNYYYHGLTSFERLQFNETLLYDGRFGSERLAYLLNTYQIHNEFSTNLKSKLDQDKNAITLEASVTNDFILPMFGESGSFILWSSSRNDVLRVVDHWAKIISPPSDVALTLSATLKLLGETSLRNITLVVEKDPLLESVLVTWNVRLPFAIPSGRQLSIGSNLNDWNPSNTSWGEVTKVSDQEYRFSKSFLKESSENSLTMEYKWVLYSSSDTNMWHGVENTNNSQNRSQTISFSTQSQTFTETITSFENITSGGSTPVGQGKLTITSVGGRTIRIYTPSNYEASTSVRYPVIYMHDGQNLFDASTSFAGEWGVDEAIESLMAANNWSGMIALGIDNSTTNRMGEYMYPTGYISYSGSTPSGNTYMNLIVNTIKPYIDSNYRTLTSRENTLIGGSSMGGLISFFGGLHHLTTFGTIIAFSTSTQLVSNGGTNIPNTLNSLNQDLLKSTKFFLYVGTSSDGTSSWPETYKGYLTNKGVPSSNVQTYLGQGHSHNEYAWRVHFPIALKWSMGFGL